MLARNALITLIISSLANIALGYFTFSRNPKRLANILFGILSFALVGWSASDYLGILGSNYIGASNQFLFLRLVFLFLALQNLSFFMLLGTFPTQKFKMNRLLAAVMGLLGLMAVILPFTGSFFGVFQQASAVDSKINNFIPGMGMMLMMITIILFLLVGFTLLILKMKKLTGQNRNQARFLLVAAIILWILVPISDFILPTFFNLNSSYALSPILALMFAAVMTYAIIRQRLFDIRPVVARSMSYGLFILVLVIIYMIAAFSISTIFMHK